MTLGIVNNKKSTRMMVKRSTTGRRSPDYSDINDGATVDKSDMMHLKTEIIRQLKADQQQNGPSQYPTPKITIDIPEGANTPEIESMVRNELSRNMTKTMQLSADNLYGRGG